ncbi:MAG TPA: amino acid adenylation domain-containing protein [Pyrinomonadaceae bacterium]|nr:amino acid adenylation domain-containing protein [Pyrinomonadaceae bacterium]
MSAQLIEGFRLSSQQKRLWLSEPDGSSSTAYRARLTCLLEGQLDEAAFSAAVESVAARHEILRTTFQHYPGIKVPLQVIAEDCSPTWHRLDLCGLDDAAQANEIEAEWRRERARPFDLEQGPLVHATLCALAPDKYLLLLSLPALCADARTLDNILREIARAYASALGAKTFDGDEAPPQYADIAEWQHELSESEEAEAGREFWREQIHASSSLPQHIPFALNERHEAPFEVERLQIELSDALAGRAETFARDEGATLAALLHTCWLVLLWRHTRQTETTCGTILAGRNFAELEDVCGLLARCVPVRCALDGELRFTDALAQVADRVLAAERWQEYWDSFDAEAAESKERNEARYFPASFEFEKRIARCDAAGVSFSLADAFVCFERFTLKLRCAHAADAHTPALRLEMQYDPQRLTAESVACLGAQFRQLLESALETPQARIDELEMASPDERRRLIHTLNATRRDYSGELLVHQLFEAQAAQTPARLAVVCDDKSLTYAELNCRANQLAHYLERAGVRPETAVALCVERSVEMLVGLLGILKAGAAYVPLDANQPASRLASVLTQTNSPLVVTEQSLAHLFDGAQVLCLDADDNTLSAERTDNPQNRVCLENLVYIIFTSGSSGVPKGVAVEHRQLLNYVQAICERVDFPPRSSFATVSTIAADLGNTMIFPALTTGGTLHVIAHHRVTDAAGIAEYFNEHKLDCLKIVPSHLEALQAHEEPAAVLPRKRLVLGGEASRSEWVREVLSLAPSCRVFNHYGPTETTVGVLTFQVSETGAELTRNTLPLGRPLANIEAYILNRHLGVVSTGETGELYIGGAGVTRGYVGGAEQTAQKFIPNPFGASAGGRLYRTGDLARYLPGGDIEFLGRADDQVKFHGHRVELAEIRHALNRHPDITDSVVVIKKDQKGGDVMLAFYIGRRELEASALRAFLAESVLEQTIPNFFVPLKKLPLTANGKIDFAALPTLEEARQTLRRTMVAPRNALEELLANIWAQVLGVERVGVYDNFFELGGHSLLATQVISQLRESLRVEVPLHLLFETPTVAGLAEQVETLRRAEGDHEPDATIQPVSRDGGELPLSFAQQRLWFVHQLEPANASYNCASAVRLTGNLNVEVLERSLSEIVRRHETLRTTFVAPEGKPLQVVSPARPVNLPFIDFSRWLAEEREAEARRLLKREAQRHFDLAAGPLLRVMLVRLGADEHLLLLVMHHIISDAWSLGILVREVAALYEAYAAGNASPLAELTVQYADFAHWQLQQSRDEEFKSHLDYWRRQLKELPSEPTLATDFPRTDERTFASAVHTTRLSRELVDRLRALSSAAGATEFMTLVAVFNALLQRHNNSREIILGTDIANRRHAELESLIGFFVNLLVLRTDLSGDPTLRELLARVKEVCLSAYAHQDVPFDRLVTELSGERKLNQTPLFQVLFVLQNAPMPELELAGLRLRSEEMEAGSAKFDVAVFVEELADGGRVVRWQYSTELFREERIRELAAGYERMLRAWTERPDEKLSEVELGSGVERGTFHSAANVAEGMHGGGVAGTLPAAEKFASPQTADPQQRAAVRRELERKLLEIWTQVLGVEGVGLHDNFFELGGDSILSIQIIAKAHQAGLRLTPKQMFQHQTIASLADMLAACEGVLAPQAEQGAVTGDAPLTPIQHWFFEQQLADAHHWNQAALLEVAPDVNAETIERAVAQLLRHHDALRTCFRREADGSWQQFIAAPGDETEVFRRIDVSSLEGARQREAIAEECERWQRSLNLEHGPLVRVLMFERGAGEPSRLLVLVHHLVVDGVSWRVLLEDLERACGQVARGEDVALPEKTTSYKLWAERLLEFARTPSAFMSEEQTYWAKLCERHANVARLPVDFDGGANTEGSAESVTIELDAEETRSLLQEVPQAHRTQINDVLLAALGRAFARWTGRRSFLFELEGHGREEIVEGLDLSRTVGWFTTHFPVWLELPNSFAPGDVLRAVKEQLRQIPHQGIGYGLLKYLRADDGVETSSAPLPEPCRAEVRFNYLGQFDQVLNASSPFRIAPETTGALHSPAAERTCLISINGHVGGGRLAVEWTFSRNLYRRETVERLAGDFLASLRELIADCRSGQAESYTPSDFPEADLDEDDLNLLLAQIKQFSQDNADESK